MDPFSVEVPYLTILAVIAFGVLVTIAFIYHVLVTLNFYKYVIDFTSKYRGNIIFACIVVIVVSAYFAVVEVLGYFDVLQIETFTLGIPSLAVLIIIFFGILVVIDGIVQQFENFLAVCICSGVGVGVYVAFVEALNHFEVIRMDPFSVEVPSIAILAVIAFGVLVAIRGIYQAVSAPLVLVDNNIDQ